MVMLSSCDHAALVQKSKMMACRDQQLKKNPVLVVWPLQSIIKDQISEARDMGLSAASTAGLMKEELTSV